MVCFFVLPVVEFVISLLALPRFSRVHSEILYQRSSPQYIRLFRSFGVTFNRTQRNIVIGQRNNDIRLFWSFGGTI
jgi:hypothetical protein